jgi:hypothetical protein
MNALRIPPPSGRAPGDHLRDGDPLLRWISRVAAALLAELALSICLVSFLGVVKLERRSAPLPILSNE